MEPKKTEVKTPCKIDRFYPIHMHRVMPVLMVNSKKTEVQTPSKILQESSNIF